MLFLPLAAAALALAGAKTDGLDEVFGAFEGIETVQGRFVQAKKMKAFKEVQNQKGYFKSSKDGRVLFVIEEPLRSVFAVKGGKVLVRYPDLDWEEITDLDASPSLGAAVRSILAVLGTTSAAAVRKAYKAKVKKEKEGWTVVLRPRAKSLSAAIDRIVMRVRPGALVERVEIHEVSGDSTIIDFSDVVFNKPVDDPLLDF